MIQICIFLAAGLATTMAFGDRPGKSFYFLDYGTWNQPSFKKKSKTKNYLFFDKFLFLQLLQFNSSNFNLFSPNFKVAFYSRDLTL